MIGTGTSWDCHTAALVATLTDSGDLHDPAWAAAIAATPRHELVPTAYQQQHDGSWTGIDTTSADGLALVYSPTTLVTHIDAEGRPVSSSTKPDLMVRMLETLDLHHGHRILEIGTGTGYNAALLVHRLGNGNVFTVDVDPDLIATTTKRLTGIGRHPQLAARDGIHGWPEHAPYDRIIVTCSTPTVPWAWAQQLAPGGKLLTDIKVGTGAGNLVLLHRHHDRLEGRFTPRWAAFMSMRHHDDTAPNRAPKAATNRQRSTTAPAQPWNTHREVWMLASLRMPHGLRYGYTLDPTTRTPTTATLTAADGSWTEIDLTPTSENGSRQIREGGPTCLWAHVEHAYQLWHQHDQPNWPRFGLTVTANVQTIWLDKPTNIIGHLPSARPAVSLTVGRCPGQRAMGLRPS
jgi:protein-L-isoaspartate O-methyltransferase